MSVNALTKKIMLSSATAALLFSVVSPFSASAASTSVLLLHITNPPINRKVLCH